MLFAYRGFKNDAIGHGLRRLAFYNIGCSRYFVDTSGYATVFSGDDSGFRLLIRGLQSYCVGNIYISALFKMLLANFVGHDSSGAGCVECPVK